jgi:hypothetical protein
MSSVNYAYKIKKDFNDKAAEHATKTAIPGYAADVVKKNENRNKAEIEPVKSESVIAYRLPTPPKPTKESMKNRKLSYFSSIVE